MAEFINNNTKNANISHTPFKLNYDYYSYNFFENEAKPYFKSYSAIKLTKKLKNVMLIYQQNLFHT